MLTEARWQKEQELMQSVFPQFKPFTRHTEFGFEGFLKGPRSGRLYRVILEADQATYPQWPPNVCMDPKVGDHWVEHRGSRALCVVRDWQAARSTFANTILAVVKYLHEHDGISSSAPRYPRGNQTHRLPDRE
jgi:hypothetical protein